MPVDDALRPLLDVLPAMVGYWDRELRNRLANEAYRDWFGVGPDEMYGMHLRELLGERLYAQNIEPSTRALAGERSTFDRTLSDAADRPRHVQISYLPDVSDGDVQGFYVLVTEVTARVEAERAATGQLERYRSIVRSVPNGFIVLFDRELRCVVADGEALRLFGHDRETLEGRTLHEALPADTVATVEPHYRRALAGERSAWDGAVGRRVLSMTVGPVHDEAGAVIGGLVVATDVTEERRGAAIGRAIEEIAKATAEGSTLAQVTDRVTSIIHDIFGLDHVALVQVEGDGRHGRIVALSPPSDGLGMAFPLDRGGIAISHAVTTGQPSLQHYDPEYDEVARRLHGHGLRVGGAAPIRVRGELWGALVLASQAPAAMDEALPERLERVSELVGLAIGNADAWEALRREATTDPVTGLPNHRTFHERLNLGLAEARRDGRGCGLILLDLDHFKAVNDTHGHPAGDTVLQEVGRRLAAVARGHELAARVGGEEFALIVRGVDESGARTVAERARRAIADQPFADVGRVTVSAGVAVESAPAPHGAADLLAAAADRALYVAKRTGRNRVVGADGLHIGD
ncbi:MAG: sensor domain-containing diguanylate cyclase [Solirubrobacteraceae bacterium]